jgi:hypothetical protein
MYFEILGAGSAAPAGSTMQVKAIIGKQSFHRYPIAGNIAIDSPFLM